MDENERSEEIGKVVTPEEDGSAEQRDSAPTPQSHEDNRRFQAARLGGERAGYERAMRELAGRESERRSREDEQMRFIAEDARVCPPVSGGGSCGAGRFRELSPFLRQPLRQRAAERAVRGLSGGRRRRAAGCAGEKGKPGCTLHRQRRQRGL